MNNERRKHIRELQVRIEDITNDLDAIASDEEDYLNNMPENLQGSERSEQSEAAVDALKEASEAISSASSDLDDIL